MADSQPTRGVPGSNKFLAAPSAAGTGSGIRSPVGIWLGGAEHYDSAHPATARELARGTRWNSRIRE